MNPANLNDDRITYFGQTDARGKKVNFGIKAKDRTRHVYVIGKTGMGKSTLLENMAVQDIKNGEGMAFIDPHGKTADLLLEYVPPERMKDVVYFAPFDTDYPISFNVLESVDPDKRHLVVSGLMSTFKKIWQDAWSARMEYILTNTLLALLEYPGATLLGVNRMLAEKDFRKDVVDHITDVSVKNFWIKEFANYTERMAAEAVPAIQNKIGQFTANALIRNMIGQPESSFNIRDLMDRRKILIINLSKGKIGESNANLLGGMLITKIYLAAMSRADVAERTLKTLPNFYLFVDEFQSFANESFADILSEARKYKLNLTIAHQYIEQMEEEVRAAVFGNVGTMIVFRVGAYDAETLEKEFAPAFTAEDIVNLGFTQIYLKLMIDGIGSAPFSATSLPPIPQPEVSIVDQVIASSREQFAHKRAEVEDNINKWHMPIAKPPPAPKASVAAAPVGVATSSSAPAVSAAPKPAPAPSSTPAPKVVVTPPSASASAPAPKPAAAPKVTPAPIARAAAPVIKKTTTVVQPFKQAFQDIDADEERVSIPASSSNVSAAASAPKPASAPVLKPVPASIPAAVTAPKPTPGENTVEMTKRVLPSEAAVASAPAPAVPVVAPISLAELAPKQPSSPVKNTQKAQSPKNVADLKSALASIIGKPIEKSAAAPAAVSIVAPDNVTTTTVSATTTTSTVSVEKKIEHAAEKTEHKENKEKPQAKKIESADERLSLREVPKEVLEKLLSVDTKPN